MRPKFSLHGGKLRIHATGAEIPLHWDFFLDVWRAARMVITLYFLRAWRIVLRKPDRGGMYFYPDFPPPYYTIRAVCLVAGLRAVPDPGEADWCFYFADTVTGEGSPPLAGKPALNHACDDIRKSRVARVFAEVFGYSLAVNPMTFVGPVVEKSEGNGRHDGRIVHCPLAAPRPGMVYQRLVDNQQADGLHLDLRVVAVGGRIPLVFVKFRETARRFANFNRRVEVSRASAWFRPEEQARLLAMARAMGLDFGAMDVLRDRRDGRLYVVDVNKTDMGPPLALPLRQRLRVARWLAAALWKEFPPERLEQAGGKRAGADGHVENRHPDQIMMAQVKGTKPQAGDKHNRHRD